MLATSSIRASASASEISIIDVPTPRILEHVGVEARLTRSNGGIMKKALLIFGGLLVLLVVVAVVAISNVNGYLAENRETLAGLASDAAGRKVSFEKAEVAFSSGLAVRIAGLRVAEDPAFGKADFLRLDDAYVGVKVLPALSGRIEVSGIRLDAPTIRVIQTQRGFNFWTLGGDEASDDAPQGDVEEAAPLAVAIAVLNIQAGTIMFEDRTSKEGLSLVLEDVETSGTDLSLDGPIALEFETRIRSTKAADKGLESYLSGGVAIESLATMAGTVALRSPILHPAIFGVRLEEGDVVEGLGNLRIDGILPPNTGNSGYSVNIRSSDARLSGFDLNEIAIDLLYRDARRGAEVTLDQVALGLAGGRIDLSGDMVLGEPGASPFNLKTRLKDLDSGELASILLGVPAGALSGTLGGDIDLAGDSLEWETLKKSLTGSLKLDVGDGALEQVNILKALVGRLTKDPGLGQLAATSIRDVIPGALSGDRTPFEGIKMALEILNGAVHARDLRVAAGDFAIDAIGSVRLDGAVNADGKILFSEDLSQKILAQVDGLGALLGDGKQIALPLHFGGTAGSPSITPDLRALSSAAKQKLKNRAAKELGDAIFGKRKADDGAQQNSDRDSAEELIREGLGRFLGR